MSRRKKVVSWKWWRWRCRGGKDMDNVGVESSSFVERSACRRRGGTVVVIIVRFRKGRVKWAEKK